MRIEIRDVVSDRPMNNTAQHATVDYEVDYLAGRIILRDPLSSVAPAPELVRASNIDGDTAYLIVDYEYLVDGDSDDGTLGARATQKLGPVRLGGTVVNEFRSVGNYTLLGGDVQIDLKRWGVIIGEYAHSYGALTSFAASQDGGLSYTDALGPAQATAGARQGNAYKAEADLHLGPVGLRPYFRGIDQGYTDTAHAQDAGFMQWGADADAHFLGVTLRAHYDERRYQQALVYDAAGAPLESISETRRDLGGELGRSFGILGVRLGARSERVDDADYARSGHRTTLGARFDVRVLPKLTLYAAGQYAVEKGGGDPSTSLVAQDNSLGAVGAIVKLPWQTNGTGEVSYGAQGVGRPLVAQERARPGQGPLRHLHAVRRLRRPRLGRRRRRRARAHRRRPRQRARHPLRRGPIPRRALRRHRHHRRRARAHADRRRSTCRSASASSWARPSSTARSRRRTRRCSPPSRSRASPAPPMPRTRGDRFRAQAKGELRQDSLPQAAPGSPGAPPAGTATSEVQWLVQGLVTWRIDQDLTLRGKIFFSNSTALDDRRWRAPRRRPRASRGGHRGPIASSCSAATPTSTRGCPTRRRQNGPTDPLTGAALGFREKAHVMSLAGDGRVLWSFSLGEKVAAKLREELTPDGNSSAWMILWINRLTFHVTRAWDALAEYRLLYGPGPALSHGVAIEVNRIIVGHLRLGVGWNFASFSDDETMLGDGSEKGFFVRAQGFY